MFNWFRHAEESSKEAASIDRSWEGSEGTYVGMFRSEFDQIAKSLSRDGLPICTRFKDAPRCAEFYDSKGRVVARVVVHGVMCAPYEALVESALAGSRPLFENLQYKGKPIKVGYELLLI
jgi:hypothetical protein